MPSKDDRTDFGRLTLPVFSLHMTLAIAVRLILQSTMSSTVLSTLACIEEGSKNQSKDTKRAFQSLKTVQNKVSTIKKETPSRLSGTQRASQQTWPRVI